MPGNQHDYRSTLGIARDLQYVGFSIDPCGSLEERTVPLPGTACPIADIPRDSPSGSRCDKTDIACNCSSGD